MRFKKLGNTDAEISEITLGTWVFGGQCWGEADDEISIQTVREAISSGINTIDTAPVYGNGRSESVIGKAIKGSRDKVFLATKCGLKIVGGSLKVDLSPSFVREDLERSLTRLGVDTIDLYQCHWPDEKTPIEETMGEMLKFVKEGKTRFIGVSNFSKAQLEDALKVAPLVSNQVQYSLLDRTIENELMPFCEKKGISILAYGPLGGGILTGKYKKPPNLPKGDVRSFYYKFYKGEEWGKCSKFVKVLESIASRKGASTSNVAINWVLDHPVIATCIAGCRTPEQVRQNASAADSALNAAELREIEDGYKKIFTT